MLLVMWRGGLGELVFGAAWATCLVGCPSATVVRRARPAPVDPSCSEDRSAAFVANGDLDGALDAIAGCEPAPAVLLQRMRALVGLGEIARAKDIAGSVGLAAPPEVRSTADAVLALDDPSTSSADALRAARSSVLEASKLVPTDRPASARAYGRARHLFEHATGASSTRVAMQGPSPIGWSGQHALWSVTLRGAAPNDTARRYVLVTDGDDAGALVPTAALDLGLDDRTTPIPWPGRDGVMLASSEANTLWSAPWLAPLTLPAGKATFAPSGGTLVVARGNALEAFETDKGARVFEWPHVDATGAGTFVTPIRYAETGPSSEHALVVDIANGAVLLHDEDALAASVSPSGNLVALLSAVAKPNAMPRLRLAFADLGAPSRPRYVVALGEAPVMSGVLSLAFDGDRGVAVLLSGLSAMMHEGSTDMLSYVALASKKVAAPPNGYVTPDRSTAFANLAKLVEPRLEAPRVVIAQWLHSQTFEEDRAGARSVVVSGIALDSGFPSHSGKPSVVFFDASARKVVRDVPLPADDLTIVDVSLAPGGRSAVVCAREGSTFLVDADTGQVLSAELDCEAARTGLWSADGEHVLASSGRIALHAKGARALVETPLPVADDTRAKEIVAKHVDGPPPPGAACLIGTMVAPYDVCR